jgi:hypothetical protein
MMTEEEARKKFCPHYHGWASDEEPLSQVFRCKGSRCMMWQWNTPPDRAMALGEQGSGYCGLAVRS